MNGSVISVCNTIEWPTRCDTIAIWTREIEFDGLEMLVWLSCTVQIRSRPCVFLFVINLSIVIVGWPHSCTSEQSNKRTTHKNCTQPFFTRCQSAYRSAASDRHNTHTHRDRRRLARSLFHNITRYLPNACLRKTHVSNAGVLPLVVTTAPGTTIAYSFLHCDEGSGWQQQQQPDLCYNREADLCDERVCQPGKRHGCAATHTKRPRTVTFRRRENSGV